jgi:hypothetical protein
VNVKEMEERKGKIGRTDEKTEEKKNEERW